MKTRLDVAQIISDIIVDSYENIQEITNKYLYPGHFWRQEWWPDQNYDKKYLTYCKLDIILLNRKKGTLVSQIESRMRTSKISGQVRDASVLTVYAAKVFG